MSKCRFAVAAALALTACFARAQTAPTPPAKPGATADAQRIAFLAIPEADRKAIQDALAGSASTTA